MLEDVGGGGMSDEDCKMAEDCICLLSYVSKHRADEQTYQSLSDAINAPLMTVWHIIEYAKDEGAESLLGMMAQKHGYLYSVKVRDKLIDVVKITDKY